MEGLTKLIEGKTKIVWDCVLIESKDDITAGDGARRDEIEGKAAIATATTVNCFRWLEVNGIPTHYVGIHDDRTFIARKVDMIPLELVARRIATGSYLKRRPDVVEGTCFDDLVVEFFEKDDANHDPLLVIDPVGKRLLRFTPSKPLGEGFMSEQPLTGSQLAILTDSEVVTRLREITQSVFEVLEEAWAKQNVLLVDLKIECGIDVETGELLVADVIDNDSWRIWPAGDKAQMKDKQVYRDLAESDDPAAKAKELGKIKSNYAWVAKQTAQFLV
jgi:phosphoribosylaminoimidazole-succinocarboxamide synthase